MNSPSLLLDELIQINHPIDQVTFNTMEDYDELWCDYGVLLHSLRDKLFSILKEITKDTGSLNIQLYQNEGAYKFKKTTKYELPLVLNTISAKEKLLEIAVSNQNHPENSSRYIFFDSTGLMYAISDEPDKTRIFYKKDYPSIEEKLRDYAKPQNS